MYALRQIAIWIVFPILFWVSLVRCAEAQTYEPQPTDTYFGGVLLTNHYTWGNPYVPTDKQVDGTRAERYVFVEPNAKYLHNNTYLRCNLMNELSWCYNNITLMEGFNNGMINADYVRVHHKGNGPSIARKTAVRGAEGQWAVWANQINLGPGSKAAFWITGDNPIMEGRPYDTTSHVMVVDETIDPTNAVIQWNARPDTNGVLLRIFQNNRITFEVTANGVVRARSFEFIQ